MVNGNQKRTRWERVASVELPPGAIERFVAGLRSGPVATRIGLCAATVLLLWVVVGGWSPPLAYRTGYTPQRNVTSRVAFQKEITPEEREKMRAEVRAVYENDREPLVQLRAALMAQVGKVTQAPAGDPLDEKIWLEFFAPATQVGRTPAEVERQYRIFRKALPDQAAIDRLDRAVAEALAPFERRGMIEKLAHTEGDPKAIVVHPKGNSRWPEVVKVDEVLMGEGDKRGEKIRKSLDEKLSDSTDVATRVFDWLQPRLAATLTLDREATNQAVKDAMEQVGEKSSYEAGEVLALADEPLSADSWNLLKLEHASLLGKRTVAEHLYYSLATLGMFVALTTLCGAYVVRYEPKLLEDPRQLSSVLALVVVAVGSAVFVSHDAWRAELVPLLLFGMVIAIAFNQELALLLSAAVALAIVVSIGQGLGEFIVLTAAVATAVLLVARIRTRRKLIYVGLAVGAVTLLTVIGIGTVEGQPFRATVLNEAIRSALWAVGSGFLMTGILPFVENLFGVQTEISLLELGDVAHPLLQELVRRAPGTYNHSINVASIAEAAAESIGAKGLLVRIGAYFHDIGKMLKPSYFVENQGLDGNRHESLLPAMSTLIIIAHIKDGADLARQHHLPQSITDFIQQHHGTTLVEYFFHRASEQSEADPDRGEVEESAFRYPGPKPQTKEAGVLMLADAVESASRALVEPTPSRIESLVHDIAMKRLLDGQFDECDLTLQELATIEESMVKSLTATYHGRIKYPEHQRTA